MKKKNLSLDNFWVKNAKINVFEEKKFGIDFFLSNWSAGRYEMV